MTRKFVHLHCHSHYSLLDGANRIPELVAHVKKLGMDSIALTDHGNLYVEIQNNGLEIQKLCAEGAVDVANRLGLPLVATCDAHYLEQGDAQAHEVLLCINTGKTLSDENRMRYGSDQFYVRPPEEMYKLFPTQAEAVQRSQEIADSVDIKLDFKKRHFPVFVPPEKKKPEDYLRELCVRGLEERY